MKIINKIKEIDVKTSHYFLKYYHHHFLNKIMILITGIGDFGMIWLGLILILSLHSQTRFLAQRMLTALLASTIIGQVTIKSLVKRKRPCHAFTDVNMLIAIPNDYSFPSGHTTSSFACATTVCFLFPKAGVIFMIFAFIMAFSRLYLFVHYLSDVTFGMILGILVGVIVMLI